MLQNLQIYQSPEELAEVFADELVALMSRQIEMPFHLAISGGKTPDLLFTVLAQKYAESSYWQHVHFWWVDERMVPPADPESNYGTANTLLFSKVNIPKENIHCIKGENNPEAEALSYSDQLRQNLILKNNWPIFDLILLGMGDDGHTASIFPDQMHLLQSNQICEVAVHPQSNQKRVTLTGPAINSAENIWFIVTGANKAEKLKAISLHNEEAKSLPAAHIRPINGQLHWYVDKDAVHLNPKVQNNFN